MLSELTIKNNQNKAYKQQLTQNRYKPIQPLLQRFIAVLLCPIQ